MTSGDGPFTVTFTNTSTGTVTGWAWDFGDPASGANNSSTLQNPSHVYSNVGAYTVTLTATGPGGGDIETKSSMITVLREVLKFDGVNDFVLVADAPSLRIATYTVGVWIKPAVPTRIWSGIIGKGSPPTDPQDNGCLGTTWTFHRDYNIWLHSNVFIHHRFGVVGGDTNTGPPNTPAGSIAWGNWNHVVITNDGATSKTYINGVQMASVSGLGPVAVNNVPLRIGANLDGSFSPDFFKGSMDDAIIYNQALTGAEITNLMNDGPGADPRIVAYYSFDNISGATLTDESGNGNDGTLYNF